MTGMGPPTHEAARGMITQLALDFAPLTLPKLILRKFSAALPPKSPIAGRRAGGSSSSEGLILKRPDRREMRSVHGARLKPVCAKQVSACAIKGAMRH